MKGKEESRIRPGVLSDQCGEQLHNPRRLHNAFSVCFFCASHSKCLQRDAIYNSLIKIFVCLTVSAEFLNGIGSRYFCAQVTISFPPPQKKLYCEIKEMYKKPGGRGKVNQVTIFYTEGENKTFFGRGGFWGKKKTIWGTELLMKQFFANVFSNGGELWEDSCQLCKIPH